MPTIPNPPLSASEDPAQSKTVDGDDFRANALGLRLDPFKLPPVNPGLYGKEGCRPNPAADWIQDAMTKLPSDVLVEMARSAARRQDLTVLQAMANAGAFRFVEDNRPAAWSEAHYADEEIPMVAALACFIDGAQSGTPTDEIAMNTSLVGLYPRRLETTPEFELFYAEQVKRFLASFSTWKEELDANVWPDVLGAQTKKFRATACVLLAGAYALGNRKLCTHITAHQDFLNIAVLRPNILGHPPSSEFTLSNSSKAGFIYPVALAYEFSHFEAAHAVSAFHGGGPLQGAVAQSPTHGPVTVPALVAAPQCLVVPEDAFRDLCRHLVNGKVPGFKNGRWSDVPASPSNKAASGGVNVSYATLYLNELVGAMRLGLSSHFEWYFKAGIDEKIHLLKPAVNRELVTAAILNQNSEAIEMMGGEIYFGTQAFPDFAGPGSDVAPQSLEHLFSFAAKRAIVQGPCDAVYLALLQAMRDAGMAQSYFEHQATEPNNSDVLYLAKVASREVIVQLLKSGLDLRRANRLGFTPIETIELALDAHEIKVKPLVDSEVANLNMTLELMRSWLVRVSAQEAIDSLVSQHLSRPSLLS